MGRVTLLLLFVAACGGPQIPTHNGYKGGDKAKPWKKAKALKWDDKLEAKAEGDLSYPDFRRAAWYMADLPQNGELDLRLEITPPGDATNDDFDLAMEILDPGNRVIAKSDLEEADAHELNEDEEPARSGARQVPHPPLPAGPHGHGRLRAEGRVQAGRRDEGKSDFPAQVAFLPALPMVPINDDTPKNYKPPTTAVVVTRPITRSTSRRSRRPTPPAEAKTARIIGVSVVGGGTQITIGLGTEGREGRHGRARSTASRLAFTLGRVQRTRVHRDGARRRPTRSTMPAAWS